MDNKELSEIYGIDDVLAPTATTNAVKRASITPTPSPIATSGTPKVATSAPSNAPLSWEQLTVDLKDCKRCRLCQTRQNIVFGEGNRNTELMFIGEGPGATEDETGRPFVGRAGVLLTKMIEAMSFKREDVYIANIVKCRPPGNREPMQDEVSACIGFINTQIELIRPKVIVCLGSTSATHLLKPSSRISNLRGKVQNYKGITVMPTYHPAYLLRNPAKKREVWDDLQEVMRILGVSLPTT